MAESSSLSAEFDYTQMNVGMVKIYCNTCKKVTDQNYLGLEFYSRKIASRCLVCRNTNFQDQELSRLKSQNKKMVRTPLKEIEKEKALIFGTTSEPGLIEELEDGLADFKSESRD